MLITDKNSFLDALNIPALLMGCIQKLNEYQTSIEQQSHCTIEKNNMGFSATDAHILPEILADYKFNEVSACSIEHAKKAMSKYTRQLIGLEIKEVVGKIKTTCPEKSVTKNGTELLVSFIYDANLISQIKNIPGRKWDGLAKLWIVPFNSVSVEMLKILGFNPPEVSKNAPTQVFSVSEKSPAAIRQEKVARVDRNQLVISFPFDQNTLSQVKSLPSRQWHSSSKTWRCPNDKKSIEMLKAAGFEIEGEIIQETTPLKPIIFPESMKSLFPFQKSGIEFLQKNSGRALIGDEMGLGKTLQAIGHLAVNPELRPAVVVCPASLKLNWKKEIEKWLPGTNILILSGSEGIPIIQKYDVLIINYDILLSEKSTAAKERAKENKKSGKKEKFSVEQTLIDHPNSWIDFIKKTSPKCVILDETHSIKNMDTLRYKGVKILTEGIKSVIGLSGTPITNRPQEFYSILNILSPDMFPSFFNFAKKFCDAKQGRFGWDFSGASNMDELNKILQYIMIRRLKSEVLKDLPTKQRIIVPVEITNRKKYQFAVDDIFSYLTKTKGKEAAEKSQSAEHLVKLEALKQIIVEGKMKAAINWIQEYLEVKNKIVIFATHQETISFLEKELAEFNPVKVVGGMSGNARNEAVEKFQNDPSVRVFIGNIKAAGVGLTLTAADATVTLELGWTPGDHDQAEDRVHRIGQTSDSVSAYYLLGINTIEEDIAQLIDSKRDVLAAVLDGKESSDFSMMDELLKKLASK